MKKDFIVFIEQHKKEVSCIEFDFGDIETNKKNPFGYSDKGTYNTFLINYKYYLFHKRNVNKFIQDILKGTEQKEMIIYDANIVDNNFFNAIIENKNIKILELPHSVEIDKKTIEKMLNRELWKLKCSVDLKKNKEMLYEYLPGLTIKNYPEVAGVSIKDFGDESVTLKVTEDLNDDQILLLKKLFDKYPQNKVIINFKNKNQIEKILNVIKSDKIIIKNKDDFNKDEYLFFDKNYNNILFNAIGNLNVEPKYLVDKEEIMDIIIDEVKINKLSPLEEYMYLYNTVKMLKEYRETPSNIDSMYSRTTDFLFFNDYIVCVGYADLLEELVNRLSNPNISIATYGCQILTEESGVAGHRRCLVKIKDEKYGIDGIYISDPTWDCVRYYKKHINELGEKVYNYDQPIADLDYYNYFLMTKDELMDENTKYYFNDITDLMFGRNFVCEDEDFYNYFHMKMEKAIKSLNPNKQITKELIELDINTISSPVEAKTLIPLIKNLYTKIYHNDVEEIDAFVQKTVCDNSVIQNKNFNKYKNKFDEPFKKLIKTK